MFEPRSNLSNFRVSAKMKNLKFRYRSLNPASNKKDGTGAEPGMAERAIRAGVRDRRE